MISITSFEGQGELYYPPPWTYSSKWNQYYFVDATTGLNVVDVSNVTNPSLVYNDPTYFPTGNIVTSLLTFSVISLAADDSLLYGLQ